jgi:NAD(P)-dependent dehydrogenase (short-subunit alcohol dehydrogenase family)
VPGRMEGKKAVVVGAGQIPSEFVGIGRATAELFAREGAEVCAVDRDLERAAATVEAIESAGGKAHAIAADVGNPDDCARLVEEGHRTMGRIDALVNNVATEAGDTNALELEVEAWDTIMSVNLRAMWLTARAAIPLMQTQGGGTIVNTSSAGSRTAGGSFFAYGVSKSGVDALTHKLAVTYAPWGIRCNSVLPSWVATQHSSEGLIGSGVVKSKDDLIEMGRRLTPLGRTGTAWDVAFAVLFFSCDESLHVTAQNLPVDGGTTAVVGMYQRPKDAPDPSSR